MLNAHPSYVRACQMDGGVRSHGQVRGQRGPGLLSKVHNPAPVSMDSVEISRQLRNKEGT